MVMNYVGVPLRGKSSSFENTICLISIEIRICDILTKSTSFILLQLHEDYLALTSWKKFY